MIGIGKALKQILLIRNVTLKSIAPKIGVSPNQLSAIANSNSLSVLPNLKKISIGLDVPSDYLLQDFDKRFLVYALDDYFADLQPQQAALLTRVIDTVLEEG